MAIKKVFKSYVPSVNYVTVRGRTCVFKEGRYETDVSEEVMELEELCRSKSNPHIYIDPAETEIDTTLQERIKAAQQEATLRVLAEAESDKQAQNGGTPQSQSATQVSPPAQSISAASLLGVTTSAGVAALASLSNQAAKK